MLEITFGDDTYKWDWRDLLMSELREVKKLTKWTFDEWQEALSTDDPDAVCTLVYLLRKRNGESVRFEDIDAPYLSFKVRNLDEPVDPPQAVEEDGPPTSTPTTVSSAI